MGKIFRDAAMGWDKLGIKKGADTYITQVPCPFLGKGRDGTAINRKNLTVALLISFLLPIPEKYRPLYKMGSSIRNRELVSPLSLA